MSRNTLIPALVWNVIRCDILHKKCPTWFHPHATPCCGERTIIEHLVGLWHFRPSLITCTNTFREPLWLRSVLGRMQQLTSNWGKLRCKLLRRKFWRIIRHQTLRYSKSRELQPIHHSNQQQPYSMPDPCANASTVMRTLTTNELYQQY